MAYRIDQAGNRTTSALSTAEIALYTAWAATAFGASFVTGITSQAALAAKLNAPQSFSNPVPQGTVTAATLSKQSVISELGLLISEAINAGNTKAQTILQAAQNTVSINTEDPIPVATVTEWQSQVSTAGLDISAAVTAATTLPDPSYVGKWWAGPLAVMIFGSWLVLQASDAELLGMANP